MMKQTFLSGVAAMLMAAGCVTDPVSTTAEQSGEAIAKPDNSATELSPEKQQALATLVGVPFPDFVDKLNQHCTKAVPARAQKRIETDGYAKEGCGRLSNCVSPILRPHSYAFTEFEYLRKNDVFLAPGLYRAELAEVGGPRCDVFKEYLNTRRESFQELFKSKIKDKCVSLEAISSFTADYVVKANETDQIDYDGVAVMVSRQHIIERVSQKVVASAYEVDYRFVEDGHNFSLGCYSLGAGSRIQNAVLRSKGR